ncbi:hypothetical protein FVQ98_17250 [Ottowia sp. GY511]|uniref:Uncharacterized protein n=1 Tax=Ottowia flava TaxID=2675430 RepID=A0ABW4KZE6_9BURK|nr:hypothetical protein [Ottowia sp. GY511]TXK23431.1 hypothetical protein FVQ98_17250 [Ottowia sp. GY511]
MDGDNLATDPQYTPTVPARFADLAKHFDIPVMDEGAEAATAPQATSDAQQLRTLCLSLLSMLTDLNKGYLFVRTTKEMMAGPTTNFGS